MSNERIQAINNALASSAMEGLVFTHDQVETLKEILDGKRTLQDYFVSLQQQYQEI